MAATLFRVRTLGGIQLCIGLEANWSRNIEFRKLFTQASFYLFIFFETSVELESELDSELESKAHSCPIPTFRLRGHAIQFQSFRRKQPKKRNPSGRHLGQGAHARWDPALHWTGGGLESKHRIQKAVYPGLF